LPPAIYVARMPFFSQKKKQKIVFLFVFER
jgi:hypothetical protein